jgi:hypothetical protein
MIQPNFSSGISGSENLLSAIRMEIDVNISRRFYELTGKRKTAEPGSTISPSLA